ncbi:hypothetical protein [Romboutsia sp.]|uniref:hypothetical protein n=1 Tax=Romboutsia sp. TaxID=1965302 RepID=UPI003F3200ED
MSILSRNNKDNSLFTQSLYQLFRAKGNTLILVYPSMRKTVFDKGYKRNCEDETKEDVYIRKSKIYTRENFKNCILEGFNGCENPTIKLIGSMQDDKYKKDMVCFAFELEKMLENDEIKIELYTTKQKNYYNKVAIKLDDFNIKMMITGNSNISTISLWSNNENNYNEDIDILIWDKYRLEKNILNNIKNMQTTLALTNSSYTEIMKSYKLINEENLKIINNNSFIISPLEPYRLKNKILEETNSLNFTKIYVKHYKLELLKGVYYYYLEFYKERKDKSVEAKEKYGCLKSNSREYMASINQKNLFYTLEIIQRDAVIKQLLFETANGNINFYELIVSILNYNDEEIKNMFKRNANQGFIKYYNEIYDYKL